MFLFPLDMICSFSTQLLDLVEGLVKIHNSSLSQRTRCLETSPPIPILHLQQVGRRLVCLFQPSWHFFFSLALHQEHLGVTTTIIRLCSITQSPPLGLARLEVEGHPPLARVAELLVHQHHLSQLRRIQAYLDRRTRLGARLELVLLLTSPPQAHSDQRVVRLLGNSGTFEPLTHRFLCSQFQCRDV